MNRNDDFTQTLEGWLRQQAPTQAPDRVLEAALEQVATQSQRRSWLQRFVGETPLANATRVAALTAVIGLAVLVGLQLNNLLPDVGEESPSPTASASPSASPSAEASPSTAPTADCVNPPVDLSSLIDVADPVACYGNTALSFDAQLSGLGVVDCPMSPEPAWLACSSFSLQLIGETRKVGAPFLEVAVDPASSAASTWAFITNAHVTGHYDDPAAQTCRETVLGGGAEPLAPVAVTIEQCRRMLVVTEVVPLAADPTGTITRVASVVDGPGISVSEAIAGAPVEQVLVNGWLLIDGFARTWLCEAISDSTPPRFDGACLRVENYPDVSSPEFLEADGVRWIPDAIQLFGNVTVP